MSKRGLIKAAALALWLLGSAAPAPANAKAVSRKVIGAKSGQLIPVKLHDKWGLVDRHGRIVIPISYEMIEPLPRSGDFLLYGSRKSAIADATGRIFIPASPRFISYFARNGLATFSVGNCHGLIDRQNRVKWEALYSDLYDFDEDSHYVARVLDGMGVLGLDGKWSIEPVFHSITKLGPNGLALAESDSTHTGFIDRDGNWVIPPGRFEDVWPFLGGGLAPARSAGKWGLIDSKGQWVVPPLSEEQTFRFDPDPSGLVPMKVGGLWGLMARGGTFVVEPRFQEIGSFSSGYFPIEADRKWGIADRRGRIVIVPRYDSMTDFHAEGLAAVTLDGKSWVIDRTGRRVFGGFEALGGFLGGGWAAAKANGKWGAVDTRGQWLVTPAYDCVGTCAGPPPPVVAIPTRPLCAAYRTKPRAVVPPPLPIPASPRLVPPHKTGPKRGSATRD